VSTVREWIARVLGTAARGRRDRELDEGLQFHLDQPARGFEARSLTP